MNEYKVKVTNFDVGRSPNIHITKRLRKTNSTLIMAKLGKVRKSANVNLIWGSLKGFWGWVRKNLFFRQTKNTNTTGIQCNNKRIQGDDQMVGTWRQLHHTFDAVWDDIGFISIKQMKDRSKPLCNVMCLRPQNICKAFNMYRRPQRNLRIHTPALFGPHAFWIALMQSWSLKN